MQEFGFPEVPMDGVTLISKWKEYLYPCETRRYHLRWAADPDDVPSTALRTLMLMELSGLGRVDAKIHSMALPTSQTGFEAPYVHPPPIVNAPPTVDLSPTARR